MALALSNTFHDSSTRCESLLFQQSGLQAYNGAHKMHGYTFYLTTEDDNWTEAPWNYGSSALGIMNVPCLIGAVLGCAYGGWFSDQFVRWVTKRNGGIQEAEFRLWLLLPATIFFPNWHASLWHWKRK